MALKKSTSGKYVPLLVIFGVLVAAILGGLALQKGQKTPTLVVVPTATPIMEVAASPSPTPTATPSATPKPTLKVTAKPKAIITKEPVSTNPIRAVPSSIKVSTSRADLDKLPAFHFYWPGSHHIVVANEVGWDGIHGTVFPGSTLEGDMVDVAIIKVHLTSAWGRGIKTGINKETFLIKEGTLMNSHEKPTVLSVPVEINVID